MGLFEISVGAAHQHNQRMLGRVVLTLLQIVHHFLVVVAEERDGDALFACTSRTAWIGN